jgi:7,8-dihydroneopterin aldolase/epimerase/oxygenase
MDIIFINELRLAIKVGIYAWEKAAPQTVQFDLEIGLPNATNARAAASNSIDDTIDYAKVVARIESLTADTHFPLVEKLAEDIAGVITGEFKAPWVRVSVAKLGALKNVKRLGVVIERGSRSPS